MSEALVVAAHDFERLNEELSRLKANFDNYKLLYNTTSAENKRLRHENSRQADELLELKRKYVTVAAALNDVGNTVLAATSVETPKEEDPIPFAPSRRMPGASYT